MHAYAQQPKDEAYFCEAKVTGGLLFDEQTNDWKGVDFKSTDRFVLRIKYLRSEEKAIGGLGDLLVRYVNVTVTDQGQKAGSDCTIGIGLKNKEIMVFEKWKVIKCETFFKQYDFNLASGRFLSSYMMGYIDGDKNENNPSIAGGVCTKIN